MSAALYQFQKNAHMPSTFPQFDSFNHSTEAGVGESDDKRFRSQNWRERVATMSLAMAKALCSGSQMGRLDPESLGLVVRIHALNRMGCRVPVEMAEAARLLGTTRRRLEPALRTLQGMAPDLLVVVDGHYTAPTLGIDSAAAGTPEGNRFRASAMTRWSGQEMRVRQQTEAKAGPGHAAQEDFSSNGASGTKKMLGKSRAKKAKITAISGPESVSKDGFDALPPGQSTGDGRAVVCPYQALADSFNATCVALSKVNASSSWNASRKSMMSNRWKERPNASFWGDVFASVQRSDYLTGRSTPWQCSFDWIIKPANLQKILEGNYNNRGGVRRGLWDQGDKARDTEVLANMKSEVDAEAPFMRARNESAQDGFTAEQKSESAKLVGAESGAQNPVHRPTRGIGIGSAGQAPAGFNARKPARSAAPERAPGHDVVEHVAARQMAGAKAPPQENAGAAPKFTPDQLRATLGIRLSAAPLAPAKAPQTFPTPSQQMTPEPRTFRFRGSEQKAAK